MNNVWRPFAGVLPDSVFRVVKHFFRASRRRPVTVFESALNIENVPVLPGREVPGQFARPAFEDRRRFRFWDDGADYVCLSCPQISPL